MSTEADLLARIRQRIDMLLDAHIKSLVAGPAAQHDRIAGKIDALQSLKKDLVTISREWQAYDEAEPSDATPTLAPGESLYTRTPFQPPKAGQRVRR